MSTATVEAFAPATSAPVSSDSELGPAFTVPSDALRDLIGRTHYCTDPDCTRFALAGVKFEFESGTLRAIGTDGRHMSHHEARIRVQRGTIDELSDAFFVESVVDLRPMKRKLTSLPKGKPQTVTVQLAERKVRARYERVVVFQWSNGKTGKAEKTYCVECPRIEGRFPNWQQVFPTGDPLGTCEIHAHQWVSAWDEYQDRIGVAFSLSVNGTVECSHDAPKAPELLRLNHTGEEFDLFLDLGKLIGYLRTLGETTVQIHYHGSGSPIVLHAHGGRYILMPMWKDR